MSQLTIDYQQLADQIKIWGRELGFQQVAITDTDLDSASERLQQWLAAGYQGDMNWMSDHGEMRCRPEQLLPGTTRIISLRMDYLPADSNMIATLREGDKAYLSRYALGRDYHKLIRKRLSQLSKQIESALPAGANRNYAPRAFVDSAPVMEKPLAEKAGLGWIGKNTLVINSKAGSWFFLGEIYTNLPLPLDKTEQPDRCGKCSACLNVCPTDAFPAPYQLDARRCISYLTIEHKGSIPEALREPMGNRVFGCDDCQAICPWNRYAKSTSEPNFSPRHQLDNAHLLDLFLWNEAEFLSRTEGSPIRRIGYERWLRNLAVGLGNAPQSAAIIDALEQRLPTASKMVAEHIHWALERQRDTNPKSRQKQAKWLTSNS